MSALSLIRFRITVEYQPGGGCTNFVKCYQTHVFAKTIPQALARAVYRAKGRREEPVTR